MKRSITLLAFLSLAYLASHTKAADKPNILFLLSDDQAWTDYGFMGHPDIKTPHLDKLASESLVFERGYLAAPVCRPSLASMITGRYPFDHGITGNDVSSNRKKREEEDIPMREAFYKHPGFIKFLTDQGYLAHQSGKWWEGTWRDGGFTHGMKDAGRHGSKSSLEIGRKGLKPITDFIDTAVDENKPFLIWYGVFLPHTPHNPPERLLKKYRQDGRAMDVAKYYAMCEWLDETCGTLMNYLEEKKVKENTLVFYICDNGWAARSTNARDPNQKAWKGYALRSKGSPYENGIRSPIMISWPSKVTPGRTKDFAHAIDIFPTFAAAANLQAPANLPGINLLDHKAIAARKTIFGTCYAINNMTPGNPDGALHYLWCIDGDWKLLVRHDALDNTRYRLVHEWDKQPIRLYNLKVDPHEKNEISGEHPEIVEKMKKKIDAWHKVKS